MRDLDHLSPKSPTLSVQFRTPVVGHPSSSGSVEFLSPHRISSSFSDYGTPVEEEGNLESKG